MLSELKGIGKVTHFLSLSASVSCLKPAHAMTKQRVTFTSIFHTRISMQQTGKERKKTIKCLSFCPQYTTRSTSFSVYMYQILYKKGKNIEIKAISSL